MATGYTNIYECPRGCKAQGGKPIAATVRGWKKHMTKQHGQYSEDELAVIVGATAPNAEQGRTLFLAEGDDTPRPGEPGDSPKEDESTSSAQPAPEPLKKVVPLKMKKLKKALSALPETILKAKGIVPDESDREIMEGAQEILEDMFGISLEVPESAWVIRSRLIALLFPIGAFLLVYLKHTFTPEMFKPKEESEAPKNNEAVG